VKLFFWLACAFLPVAAQTDDLAAKSHEAKQAMAAGKYTQAAALYRELVRALPDSPEMRMSLGVALHSAGKYREAIPEFESVRAARPDWAPVLLFLGLAHAKLGESAAAIPPLELAVKVEPSNKIALLELGDAYLSTGRAREAAAAFERLTALDPDSAKAWQGLGLSCVAFAREAFEELEKEAPESSYWFALAGRAKLDAQQYGPAFYYLKRAVTAKPHDLPGAREDLVRLYRSTGHEEWARREEARVAATRDPTPAGTGTARADYDEALQYSRKATEAFSRLGQLAQTAELHALLGQAARVQEHYVQAEQEYREALKLDPSNRQMQKELAQTFWLAHDFDSALPILERLRAVEPHSAELNFETGDIWLEKNEAAKALPLLSKAVEIDPRNPAAQASLGKTLLQLGRAADAIPHLAAALGADRDGTVHYQLARAYRETGQEPMATRAFADFQRLYRARQERREAAERETQITAP
jgi:tetratricopeptide (TPR) repeat protein